MKKMIFVSTGRCGTTRIAQILAQHLDKNFTVTHQMPQSRFYNILGNIMYCVGGGEWLKRIIFKNLLQKNSKSNFFISTDPLTAMIIPRNEIDSVNTCIVHIHRDPAEFAKSFYRFSRERRKSFIAHNFIPFWQPYLFPLENCLSSRVLLKYEKIAVMKNAFFIRCYSGNPNFKSVSMQNLFTSNILNNIVNEFFGTSINIPLSDLQVTANQTNKN